MNIFLLLLIFLLFACTNSRQENLSFKDWDQNQDNLISKIEFEQTFTQNYYQDWNHNDDPYLDDEDFLRSVFYVWDENKDEKLNAEEWVLGYDYFYGDYIIDDFVVVDTDKDGSIDYTEYKTIISPTNMYIDWDQDDNGLIEGNELAFGLFKIWDLDNSQYLELDEYGKFDKYYFDI